MNKINLGNHEVVNKNYDYLLLAKEQGIFIDTTSQYDDPIGITQDYTRTDDPIYDGFEYFAVISYKDAKEFSNNKVLDSKKVNIKQRRHK